MPRALPYHVAFLLAMVAVALIRVRYWRHQRTLFGRDFVQRESTITEIRQVLAMAAFLVIILHTIKPDLLAWMEFPVPYLVRGLGVPLSIGAVAVLARTAGEATACLQRPGQRALVTTGVYALVRHPLYSAAFATIVALTLLSANWVVGLLGLGLAINLYLRSRREDRELAETFGHAFAAYAVRTPAFLPRHTHQPAPAP